MKKGYQYLSELAFYIERIQVALKFYHWTPNASDRKSYRDLLKTYVDRWDLLDDLARITGSQQEKIAMVADLYAALQKSDLPEPLIKDYAGKIRLAVAAGS